MRAHTDENMLTYTCTCLGVLLLELVVGGPQLYQLRL